MMGESPNLTVKTTLMLLQHVGGKLTPSSYTDSVSTSQHLKNVSFRSYDLAHCKIIESSKSLNWLNIIMIHALCRFFLVTVHSPPRNQNTEYIRLAVNRNPDRNGRCLLRSKLRLNAKGPSEDNLRVSTHNKSFNYFYTVYT